MHRNNQSDRMQGPRSYFESGGAKNTFFLATLYNFQKGGRAILHYQPLPLRFPLHVNSANYQILNKVHTVDELWTFYA